MTKLKDFGVWYTHSWIENSYYRTWNVIIVLFVNKWSRYNIATLKKSSHTMSQRSYWQKHALNTFQIYAKWLHNRIGSSYYYSCSTEPRDMFKKNFMNQQIVLNNNKSQANFILILMYFAVIKTFRHIKICYQIKTFPLNLQATDVYSFVFGPSNSFQKSEV